ncbi:MAG: Na+/H+ antiporter subunit E [Candidatus Firestonebacteria bacterium]|nr:Na+/H+ antiporter subunit E [Candidatus Firestonebacteria bacterium]
MIRKILNTTFWLWLFWTLLIASASVPYLVLGIIGILGITYLVYYFIEEDIIPIKWNIRIILHSIIYIYTNLIEIIYANIDVAERVLDPELPINPSIIKIKTSFKDNDFIFTALANTITITPGTIAVDSDKDYIYVHFLAENFIESLSNRNLPQKLTTLFNYQEPKLEDKNIGEKI